MEVARGIHRIDTELGSRTSSLYVLVGEDACLLFDVGIDGTATRELAGYLETIGLDPSHIRWAVVSHADVDHFGGLASVKELVPSAARVCHRLDAPLVQDYSVFESRRAREFRDPWGVDEAPEVLAWTREVTREATIDLQVSGGETLRLGGGWEVELLHVPGHSYGHLAIHDPRSRALIVADAVLGDAVRNADGSPAFPPTYRYVDSYLSTVDRLAGLHPDLLLTAHYPTMAADDGAEFLASSRVFAERVEEVIRDEVKGAGSDGLTLRELLVRANPRLGRWPAKGTEVALAYPVVGHLERLLAHGHVTVERDGKARIRSTT